MKPKFNGARLFAADGLFFLVIIVGAISGIENVEAAETAAQPQRPNVVLIMTDDQGYGDLACNGNAMLRTPSIDVLSKQSVCFTNFHVDPTCAETRSALMTGRYASRTGVWHTIMGRSLLRRDEVTMADVFRGSGYRTGVFGKWHLGDNYPFRPQDRGFDEVLVHGGGGVTQTPDFWGNDYFDDTYFHNGKPEKQTGYCTDVFFRAATQFIEASKDRPFFCYIPTNAAHGPFFVDPKYSQPYVKKGVPQTMANFYGMITNIDENVGRLREQLKKWGLEKNTVFIFMTDNGTAAGVARGKSKPGSWRGYNADMRAQKGSQYEGGHRVPCIVHWPDGGWNRHRKVSKLAAHFDLLPTFVELCGLKKPHGFELDGVSLTPLLNGTVKWKDRTLLVHSQRLDHPEKWRKSSVMTERWRLVDGKELYEIATDPGQKNNVAAKHTQIVTALRKEYEAWWKSISPRFNEYCRVVLGSEKHNPTTLTCHDWHAPISQVPWNQNIVQRGPQANGFWAIDVERQGRYEIILRRWPKVAPGKLPGKTARISIAGVELSKPIEKDATSVTFQTKLPAGKAKLQTWLTEANGKSRGAFFVEVSRVD